MRNDINGNDILQMSEMHNMVETRPT